METKIERIERLGQIAWYGYSRYVQEVEKSKRKTTEQVHVIEDEAIEMPDHLGQNINYLV